VKVVKASNTKALGSSAGTIKRPTAGTEVFGASITRSVPTQRMSKSGAISGKLPPRGTR
jgi:hypothetical protein